MVSNKTFDQLYDELTVAQQIEQCKISFRPLYNAMRSINPKKILEIGVNQGGTSKMWQHLLPEDGLVVSVDLGLGSEYWTDFSGLPPVKMVVGDSHDRITIERVRAFAPFDAIFIDGDHSYEGVKADYNNYVPMVRSGGLVSFHDHGHGPILQFWNELQVPGKVVLEGSLTIGMFYKE